MSDGEAARLYRGQPRIVSFHIDMESGERHLHCAWFRVDLETMRSIDPGLYKNHLVQLARTLEREFALREVSSQRQPQDRARAAERDEYEESKRLGTDVRAIRTAILDCLERADSGKAFQAALEDRGFMLANGDKRDCFVVIDQAGGHHALNKKLTGQTLAQTRERLADLNRSQLPGAEQAQAMQRERHHQTERTAESRSAPEQQPRRYDSLRATERAVAREQFHGRYDDLRAAEPPREIVREFRAAAARATEPDAPIFDRDAASRVADERIIDAAIAKDQAASAPAKARQRQEPEAGIEETRGAAAEPAQAAPQAGERAEVLPELIDGIDAALGAGSRAATQGIAGLAKAVEKILSGVFSFFGGGEPKLTRQQQHDRAQAEGNEETLHAHAAAEAEQVRMTEQDWRIFEQDRQQQREDLERDLGYRDRGRERERERDDGYELER